MQLKRFLFTFTAILISLIVFLYFTIFSQAKIEKDIRSQYLKGGNFQLLNDGKPFELTQLKGRPVILYFGYTSCPDVCPVGLALIRDALNSSDKLSGVPAVFVTLDPERDTLKILKDYVAFFHANIIPLTGSLENIRAVIESYGGFFRHVNKNASEDGQYLVDHSAYYYVIDSSGELIRVYDHSVSSKELAETVKSLL